MTTWHDAIYRTVVEYDLKQDGVAAGLAMQDFEGEQDGRLWRREQESGETLAGQSS